jgi:glycosyltransferase involved in cell wall biosynthesis
VLHGSRATIMTSVEAIRPSLSVIVPAYRSAASLPDLIDCLTPVLSGVAHQYEVILVNDASPDNTWEVIQGLAAQHQWVHGISLMRNYGQHNALLCGIREAQYEIVVTMDDDLQHPPDEIPRLLSKLAEGFDVVYGPPMQERHGVKRDLASQITKLALKVAMGVDIAPHVSAFRVFRTQIRDAFAAYQGAYVSIDVLLSWGTTRFAFVPVRHVERRFGRSNYTLGKLAAHALNMITGFSVLPLQVASVLGFVATGLGVVLLVYVLARFFLEGGVVPGFAFLASTVVIFSGVQLFALGIIGEYLARMHFRIMDRPSYIIRSKE